MLNHLKSKWKIHFTVLIFQFLGQWFVNRRTENPTFRADCATIEFSEGNNVTNLNIRGVNQNFLEEASGNAVHQSGSARFTVTVNSQSK